MKKLLVAALLALAAAPSRAQTLAAVDLTTITPPAAPAPVASGNSLTDLMTWLGTQQAQLGTSMGFSKVKYVTTWWDASSWGQKGINIGQASALDYMDLGFGTAAANAQVTRYGFFVPIHFGNIVNSASSWMPSVIGDHVHLTTLPNVTLALVFLYPQNGVLKDWTIKKDGQGSVAYRFGGP
jgi:hypothetical protein